MSLNHLSQNWGQVHSLLLLFTFALVALNDPRSLMPIWSVGSPAGPCLSVGPCGPVAPVAPCCPVGPCGPGGPTILHDTAISEFLQSAGLDTARKFPFCLSAQP